MADIPANLPREVGNGREDAARQQIAFDFGKPELDLIEPGRIRRREVQMDVRVVHQKRAHGLRLVGRQVSRRFGSRATKSSRNSTNAALV